MMVFKKIAIFLGVIILFSCDKKESCCPVENPEPLEIKAVDASFVPEIRASGFVAQNADGQAEDMLTTLQNAGVNTIRIRLWNQPTTALSGFQQVKAFAAEVKSRGMKVWLCPHYSDTWADPGSQTKPAAWQDVGFEALKDSVYQFTQKGVVEIQPDFVQIGNEINGGLLWPEGRISNQEQMKALLSQGIQAVRDHAPNTRIMLHYAGHENAVNFFAQLESLDFDMIALSYYPFWHGKSFFMLDLNLSLLSSRFNKKIVIAETAYPFTLTWNDQTNNVIGLADQLHPDYPATGEGQKNFFIKLKEVVSANSNGAGICYWGADWVAYKGSAATDGSSWENMALWGFDKRALPAMGVFKD